MYMKPLLPRPRHPRWAPHPLPVDLSAIGDLGDVSHRGDRCDPELVCFSRGEPMATVVSANDPLTASVSPGVGQTWIAEITLPRHFVDGNPWQILLKVI